MSSTTPTTSPTDILVREAAVEAELNATVVSTYGYTRGQLLAIFNAITDPTDWRGPIACDALGEAVIPTVEAIKFFTATVPTVTLDMTSMQYHITSVGYRMGPAGE